MKTLTHNLLLAFIIWLAYAATGLFLGFLHRGKHGLESRVDHYFAYATCWPMLLIDLYVRRK